MPPVNLPMIYLVRGKTFEWASHHTNMSVKWKTPYTQLLYSKTGVYRGIQFFLIFAPKQILWVLVRTASYMWVLVRTASLTCTHSMFWAKILEIHLKLSFFTDFKNRCIFHGHVCVMMVLTSSFSRYPQADYWINKLLGRQHQKDPQADYWINKLLGRQHQKDLTKCFANLWHLGSLTPNYFLRPPPGQGTLLKLWNVDWIMDKILGDP